MNKFRFALILVAMALLHATQAMATVIPQVQPQEINTVKAVKSGNDVQLNWLSTNTTPPFTVARDNQTNFSDSTSIVLVGGVAVTTYSDAGELLTSQSRFYLVSHSGMPPRVFTIASSSPAVGDTVQIMGWNLGGASLTDSGNNSITPSASSNTEVDFVVPASMKSGRVRVRATKGGVYTPPLPYYIHKIGVGFTTPGQVAVDNVNNLVFYADRSTTTAMLWKIDTVANTRSTFGTTWPANPIGLTVGPWQGAGNYLFAVGMGNSTGTSNGDVYRYDITTGVRTLIHAMSPNGTTDPTTVRALTLGPDPADVNGNKTIFALTMPNASFPSYVRHLTNAGLLPPRTDWQVINATGGASAVNAPGGVIANGNSDVYETNGKTSGQARSSVEYWQTQTLVPPARTLAFTSDPTLHKIYNAAQLAVDDPNPTAANPVSVYVANRIHVANPGIPGSVVKLNVTHLGDAVRANPKAITIHSDIAGDLRGVAVQYADAVGATGKYSKYLWATNATGVFVMRAKNELRYRVKIADHARDAFVHPIEGPGRVANPGEIEAWVGRADTFANHALEKVGFQVNNVAAIGSVTEPSSANEYSIALSNDALTNCGAELESWAALMDPYDINVFIVHGIRLTDSQTVMSPDLGLTNANAQITCGGRAVSIVLISYGNNGQPAQIGIEDSPLTDHVMAHEFTHLLIHYAVAPAGQYSSCANNEDDCGHSTQNTHLMYSVDTADAIDLNNADDIVINDPTNPMRKYIFLPEGGLQ